MTKFDRFRKRMVGTMQNAESRWVLRMVKPWDRHAMILATAGYVYILLGIANLISTDADDRKANMVQAFKVMPYEWWYVGFMIVGLIAIVASRWPATPKTLGYSVLSGWTAAYAGFMVLGGLMEPFNLSYVVGGYVWALMAFLWWAISGLVCPPKEREDGDRLTTHSYGDCGVDCGIRCIRYPESVAESESQDDA